MIIAPFSELIISKELANKFIGRPKIFFYMLL